MEIISRSAAKALGQKRYFTGRPCIRGHTDERYVSTGSCRTCSAEAVQAHTISNLPEYRERWKKQREANPAAQAAKAKRWRDRNLDSARAKNRDAQRWRRYGATPEQIEAFHAAQDGNCPGCAKPLDHAGTPHLDHCHETNKVRGLLCARCNLALGHALDDPATLRRLAEYLDQNCTR